jgi:hypothetical protein
LTREEFHRGAGEVVDMVFANFDSFGKPFQPSIASRLILYPLAFWLATEELSGLRRAAAQIGDDGFYEWMCESPGHNEPLHGRLSKPEWDRDFDQHPPRYYAVSDDIEPPSDRFLETAWLSSSGRWGMIISHEDHAVIGGTTDFIDALRKHLPALEIPQEIRPDGTLEPAEWIAIDDQVTAFIRAATEWSHDPGAWLPDHLAHIYGDGAVDSLIAKAGVTWA